jgi:hypothetical protein
MKSKGDFTRYEYRTRVYDAGRPDNEAAAYIASLYPDHELRKYDFMKLEAFLAEWGDKGWELAHLESINAVGDNGDLGLNYTESYNTWRRAFFCVFRRPYVE